MNLESILPLLMKNSDPKAAAMMSALSGGDKSKMIETLAIKDEKTKDLFSMINMMQNGQKKAPNTQISGLKAIYNFAPKDILGIMVKYFSR